MAHKKDMKISEARIIMYLMNVDTPYRYCSMISFKLKMEYGYTIRILKGMLFKDWVTAITSFGKIYYKIKGDAEITTKDGLYTPVALAKKTVNGKYKEKVNQEVLKNGN